MTVCNGPYLKLRHNSQKILFEHNVQMFNDNLIDALLTGCLQMLLDLRTLRQHGMPSIALRAFSG